MKKYILLIILLMPFPFSGKTQTYHKLIRENAFWDEATYLGTEICNYSNIKRIKFSNDTIIGINSYKKIVAYDFYNTVPGPFCPPFAIDTVSHILDVFMREDTVSKKVYITNSSIAPAENLIFDFSLQPGDTFNNTYGVTSNLLVVGIDSIQIFTGDYRERIVLIDLNNQLDTAYMYESIGSSQGLFNGLLPAIGAWNSTLCVKENQIAVYGSECNYYFTGVVSVDNPPFCIYPNPASDVINCVLPENEKFEIVVYNTLESIVHPSTPLRMTIEDGIFQINISMLPSGIYFIEARGEKVLRGKFVKE